MANTPKEKCAVKNCKQTDVALYYYGSPMCAKCWQKYSERSIEELFEKIGLVGTDDK